MNRKYLGLLVALAAALPLTALAATQSATMGTGPLVGGALSITNPAAGTFPSALVSAGTTTGPMHQADWSDATVSGNGWNGTVAAKMFHIVPTWVVGATSGALADLTSGQDTHTYTGSGGKGQYTVTVTTASAGGSSTVAFSWAGAETGTGTATKGTPALVGGFGDTITFAVAQSYNANDTYSAKVGALDSAALAFSSPPAISTVSGGAPPTATGSPTQGVGSASILAFGSPHKFVTAAVGDGAGTYTVTPSYTLTWDPTKVWALNYMSEAQYTISQGP